MNKQLRIMNLLISFCMIFCMLASPAFSSAAVFAQEVSPTPTGEATSTPSPEESPTPAATETTLPTEQPTETPATEIPTATEAVPAETEAPEVVPLEISAMGRIIPDQYIIVYKDKVQDDQVVQDAADDVKKNGGEVKHIFNTAFKGFAAKLSPGQLKKLRQDPRIAYIEADQIIRVSDSEISTEAFRTSPTWGLDRIDQADLPLNGEYFYPATAGTGVNVYVIDSGIRTSHVDFGGRAVLAYDNVGDGCLTGDCDGHGTHVAGIIGGNTYGVANLVSLFGVRVLDANGEGSYSQVIAGINWVIANHVHPAVINMSLGGDADTALDAAVNAAISHGITVVVAAGNDSVNACSASPARVPNAITVGATAADDSRAYFSNYGTCLDIFAPGYGILSDSNLSTSATETLSGTSMAAPFVAGAAALYLSTHPSASPATVTTDLKVKATKNHVFDPMGSPNNLLFAPNKLTAAPVLLDPENGGSTSSLGVVWQEMPDILYYDIQIDNNSDMSSPFIEDISSEAPWRETVTYIITEPLAEGKYYWRVRAHNTETLFGPWSSIFNFTYDITSPVPPTLLSPANGAFVTSTTPTFKWSTVSGAKYYTFMISETTNPWDYFYRTPSILTTNYYTPPASILSYMKTYYWFARASDAAHNDSEFAGPFAVTIIPPTPPAPLLDTPASGFLTNNSTPELKWKTTNFAVSYEVQVDNAYTFTEPLIQYHTGITDLGKVLDTLPDGKYFWRARAMNANNVYSAWSGYRYFTVDTTAPAAPVLKTPLNNADVVGTPTFYWNAAATAVRYQFAYGTSADPLAGFVYQSGELSTAYHKPPVMTLMTPYYWFARAKDAAGNWSDWSIPFTVKSVPPKPAAPVQELPASGYLTNNPSPELKWKTTGYAVSYELQIAKTYTFTAPLTQNYTGITDLSKVVDALPDGKYYWHVRAVNANNVPGAWSGYRYFTVDTTAPAAPVLKTPLNNADVVGTPTFYWNASATAVRYQFAYGTSADPLAGFVYQSGELSTAYHKPPVMTLMTPYYWFARARDAAGNWSDWSIPFTVKSVPPKPAAPVQELPASGYLTNNPAPELKWKATGYAVSYELQIATTSTFNAPLTQDHTGIAGLSRVVDALPDGKYYWRVRAMNANNVYGAWSTSRYFTVDTTAPAAPVLKTPLDTADVVGTPTFYWNASATAVRYQFAYGTSADPLAGFVYQSGELSTAYHKPPAMTLMTPYYWFARAKDAAGNWSDWSTPNAIKIVPPIPGSPTLVYPNTGDWINDNESVYYSWNESANADRYEIQIDDSSTFASPNYSYVTEPGITGQDAGPFIAGTYYWRVRALNLNGNAGNWSAARQVNVFSTFNYHFSNPETNLTDWDQHPGAAWYVSGDYSNDGLGNDYTSSISYNKDTFSDFYYKIYGGVTHYADSAFDGTHAEFGMIIRGNPTFDGKNDWKNGYYFEVIRGSSIGGDVKCWNFYQITNGVFKKLTPTNIATCSDAIDVESNYLAVNARGNTLTFFINDRYLWQTTVSGPMEGRVGVFTKNSGSLPEKGFVIEASLSRPLSAEEITTIIELQ